MTDFHLLSYTSTSEIPALTEAWKSYPFRAEPPCIGLYRAYYLNVYRYHHHQINGMINWPGLFGFGVNAKLWANLEIIIVNYDRWQIQIFPHSFFSIPSKFVQFFSCVKKFHGSLCVGRRGILNLFTEFLLYNSMISSGRSSHLNIRNSSIMPCKGFSFLEAPRLAHFHCACMELLGTGTAVLFRGVASISSFARRPLIYSRALPFDLR